MRKLILVAIAAMQFHHVTSAQADSQEAVRTVLMLCVGGSYVEKIEGQGNADLSVSIKKLFSSGAAAGGNIKFSKEEMMGLIGGINSTLTKDQTEQADKVRECVKPHMAKIIDAILASK